MSDPTSNDTVDETPTVTPATRSDEDLSRSARHAAPTMTADAVDEEAGEPDWVPAGRRERVYTFGPDGRLRWGAAILGWTATTGVAVLLLAVVAGTGTALGLTRTSVDALNVDTSANVRTVSLLGAAAIVLILAIAYLLGGYTAARMAGRRGMAHGFAVWVVGVVVTVAVALVAVRVGSDFDVLGRLSLPRIPVDEGTITGTALVALLVVLVITALAAVAGGAWGQAAARDDKAVDLR